jgi:hypothetical protein
VSQYQRLSYSKITRIRKPNVQVNYGEQFEIVMLVRDVIPHNNAVRNLLNGIAKQRAETMGELDR